MNLPTMVPEPSTVVMTASGELRHCCPHVDEIDEGEVSITWRPQGQTFELHSLAAYLGEFRDAVLSHEEITDRIRLDLGGLSGVAVLKVETLWRTAGLRVVVESGA